MFFYSNAFTDVAVDVDAQGSGLREEWFRTGGRGGVSRVGRSLRSSREESSVWGHVRPHCTSAKCHYRRKTWAFPRPRAHMHAHEASERADTHTCHTRKQARHLPESLRGLPRAHDHIISHAAARKGAQNREVRKAPREHRGTCGGSARQPRGRVAPSLRLPRQPLVSRSARPLQF